MTFKVYRRFWGAFTGSLLLDQASKAWIVHHLPSGSYDPPPIVLINGLFNIVHIHNDGAAWGMLSGYGWWIALLGVMALGALWVFRRELGMIEPPFQWSFGLMAGGIAGNLLDRLLYHGHVVDFLDVQLPGYRWPAFNVADSAITIGVALYFYHTLRPSKTSIVSNSML